MKHHDAAIRLDPKQYWTYINRGNAKARLKEFASAISDFQAAQALQPAAPESHTNLGNALREQGHYEAPLFNTPKFTKSIEEVYMRMLKHYLADQPAKDFVN